MLEIENLTKRFGAVTAVAGLSLRVGQGEVLGFLGPNGAGKTTTMKMVTGFLAPDSGTARICGHDIGSDTQAAQRRLGYLPEGAPAYGEMTPREFLAFIARARGLEDAKAAASLAVSRTGLAEVLDRPIETLSKGFRRRVGLAQAILHDPEVLILDEPTDGLDPNQKHAVRELIRAIAATKTIVISTHLLEEVEAVCSRAVIINRGMLVADGTPAELAERAGGKLENLFRGLTSTEDTASTEDAAA
jgi:ABC-2 type transport system ATP-binding protein